MKEGSPLWAGKFEETANDLFAVQDSISEAVARSLLSRFSGEDKQKITRRYTENTQAYSLYVKGRYFLDKLTREGFQKARDYFQHAIKEDPAYAAAYAGLADSYFLSDLFPPEIAMAKAKAAATKALEIDGTLAEAYMTLAGIKIFYEWDLQGAEAAIKRGMELRPNYAWAHLLSARYWQAQGRLDQATAEILRAQTLDPLSIKFLYVGGELFFCAGQNERAVEQFQTAVEIDPDFQAAHAGLALAYEQQGTYDQAVSEWQKSLALSGNKDLAEALGQAYARSGFEAAKKIALRKLLDQLGERSKREYVSPGEFAILCSRLGEKDQALDWLERAYEERDWIVFQLGVDPLFASFHSDPRFVALLKKLNSAKQEGQAHKPDSV
jgi:tetratricopeptide (TPR) repeat protein